MPTSDAESRPTVFDGWRPPVALAIAAALAAAAAWRWPWARWLAGALLVLALLRALSLAAGARAAGRDPEAGGKRDPVPAPGPPGPAGPPRGE